MKIQKKVGKSIWYYIKNYKFKSLLIQNFLFIVTFATVPLITTIYRNYVSFEQEMNLRMEESNMELLLKSATVIDNIVSDVMTILEEMQDSPECRYLYESNYFSAQYRENAEWVKGRIEDYKIHYPYVKSICLYSKRNQLVLDDTEIVSIEEIEGRGYKWYDIDRIFPMEDPYTLVGDDGNIMFCAPLYREESIAAGLLVVNVDTAVLGNRLEREAAPAARSFFILDISGQAMYCNNEENLLGAHKQYYQRLIGKARNAESSMEEAENSTKVVSVSSSIHRSWKYALVTDKPLYTEEMGKLRNLLVGSVITGVLPSLLVAYLITVVTYRPVKKILNVVEKPEEYIYNEREASNEVLYITSNILNTIDRKEKMEDELTNRLQSLRVAQSLALQFQVDPHFLFNTLEMIKWTTVEDMGSGNRASRQLTKVARLYRIALESDNMILPLKEEIEFLHLYIEILDIRYDGSIRFEWEIDEKLYDCRVVKLCIQPLIENAVKHGLKPKNYNGTIWIRAERVGETMCICVENDGVEMSVSEIAAMNHSFAGRNGFQDARVGLLNINERIKLLYGLEYGLKLEKRGEGLQGMKVILTFPIT
ncbi:MAG: histidine kinase [Lachnospiraceae bacterium]|nr:histidine kinase [Lachnospiraceae bacterium]